VNDVVGGFEAPPGRDRFPLADRRGRSGRAIARQPRVIERHVQAIFQELGLPGTQDDNRSVLVRLGR